MNTQTQRKYIDNFSNELFKFISFIDGSIPTNETQKIIEKFPQLNMLKIMARYHKLMTPFDDLLKKHNEELFTCPRFIIPEFDMSFYWKNLLPNEKPRVWDTLRKLLVCCNLIFGHSHTLETKQCQMPITHEAQQSNTSNLTFDPFVGIGTNNANISIESIKSESENSNFDPLMDFVGKFVDTKELKKQFETLDETQISQMTDNAKQMITSSINDSKLSDFLGNMMTDISKEITHTDFTNGNIMQTALSVAGKLAPQLTESIKQNKFTKEDLNAAATSILSNIGLPDNVSPQDILTGNPAVLMGMLSKMSNNSQIPDMSGIIASLTKK